MLETDTENINNQTTKLYCRMNSIKQLIMLAYIYVTVNYGLRICIGKSANSCRRNNPRVVDLDNCVSDEPLVGN